MFELRDRLNFQISRLSLSKSPEVEGQEDKTEKSLGEMGWQVLL